MTAAVLAAAGAALALRRRGSAGSQAEQPAPVVPGPPSTAPVEEAVGQTWSCECGQEFRVQGEDRHRVYWMPDAAISDPLLDPTCPSCERPLPREHEVAASAHGDGEAATASTHREGEAATASTHREGEAATASTEREGETAAAPDDASPPAAA